MSAQITSLRSDYPPPRLLIRLIAGCLPPVITARRHHSHPAALIHTLTTAPSQLSGRPLLCLLPLLGRPIHAVSVVGPLRPGPARLMPRPAASSRAPAAGEAALPTRPLFPTRREGQCSSLGEDIGRMLPVRSGLKYSRVNLGVAKLATRGQEEPRCLHCWTQCWAPQYEKDKELPENVQRRETKMKRGLGCYKEGCPRSLFWLRKTERGSHNPYKYL